MATATMRNRRRQHRWPNGPAIRAPARKARGWAGPAVSARQRLTHSERPAEREQPARRGRSRWVQGGWRLRRLLARRPAMRRAAPLLAPRRPSRAAMALAGLRRCRSGLGRDLAQRLWGPKVRQQAPPGAPRAAPRRQGFRDQPGLAGARAGWPRGWAGDNRSPMAARPVRSPPGHPVQPRGRRAAGRQAPAGPATAPMHEMNLRFCAASFQPVRPLGIFP